MTETFNIGTTPVGQHHRPYLIAEVGINARDDLELAKSHIEAAAEAGADAVKFQTHIADREMQKSEMERIGASDVYETVAANEWSVDDHETLQDWCIKNDVDFLSTPFSTDAVDILSELDVPALKIGSGELTNRHILARAAETGKPLIVSTGMTDYSTIRDAYEFLRKRTSRIAFLYCVSAYPTQPEDLHLSNVDELREELEIPIGFSDHSLGVEAPIIALGHNVSIIEKHFTIDRRLPGPDQEVSVTPEELSTLVDFIDYREKTRGQEKPLTDEEGAIKQWANHSIVTTTRIEQGERFTEENISTKRPATGISAERYFDIIGAEASTGLAEDTILTDSDIE